MNPLARALLLCWPAALVSLPVAAEAGGVVINEIHFHPADKRATEFVELHNAGDAPVGLGGWRLEGFVFPEGAVLKPGGFSVVAVDPAVFEKEFGFRPLGPLPGKLKHGGESLKLRDASGKVVDAVRYGVGFPWPSAAGGGGSSLERVDPWMPGNEPSAWRSSGFAAVSAVGGVVLVGAGDGAWRARKGAGEPPGARGAWRMAGYKEDAAWKTVRLSVGYGDDDDATVLTDMQGRYTSLYLRRAFELPAGFMESAQPLLLRVRVDDGCVVWLNGHEVARLHVPEGELRFNATAQDHEAGPEFEEVPLADAHRWLVPGANVLAVHALNASLQSSDLTIDAELRTRSGAPLAKRPTPGAVNSVHLANPASQGQGARTLPGVLAVEHRPAAPHSGEPVTVTARVNPGAASVALRLQVVEPGRYVRRSDEAFEKAWVDLEMHDDGRAGDAVAGDGTYTVVLPAEQQKHRHLARYRVVVKDAEGRMARAPGEDDTCANFAWFVYDGMPAWRGASVPGKTAVREFSADFLKTLPAYHLVADGGDVARSQWEEAFYRRPFFGTLVYEGVVYDHVRFHNRGTGSTYIAGKNKWGLKFNRGHEFAARDVHGKPYAHRWDSLNLNPGLSTPYLPVHCGIAGLDEAVSFRAYQLAGVPSANTHWVQWRVVSTEAEAAPGDQYAGDVWGLALCVQDMDGDWLQERGLADGNVYSTQSGRKHLARGMPADGSDWNAFLDGVRAARPEKWWREHLDLPAYNSFHALNRVLGNVDLRPDGNHGYYHRPDGRWAPVPWDLDMMLVPRHHQPGAIDAARCLEVPVLKREYQSRAREVMDLFCEDPSPNGGQVGQLVAELSRILAPSGFEEDWARFDEAVWNQRPRYNAKGNFFVNPAFADHFGGRWKRVLASADLKGFCRYIVDFCTDARPGGKYAPNDGDPRGYGFGYLAHEAADSNAPARPVVSAVDAGVAGDGSALRLKAGGFSGARGARFGAVQWRVARIAAPGVAGYREGEPLRYELEGAWTSGELQEEGLDFTVPAGVCEAGCTYRIRARQRDDEGRWSRWSVALQIVAVRGR